MNKYAKWIDYVIAFISIGAIATALSCSEEYKRKQATERILRSEGVVIEKVADPAGYDWGFWEGDIVYRPDRYYLKVRLDNGDVTDLKVDAVTYMHTNVGDRVKNR